jgi:hypothetical protein
VPGPEDLASLVHELVQQQAAFGQQQATLLQLQAETVGLQRLLIERALGTRELDLDGVAIVGPSTYAVLEPQVPSPGVVRADLHAAELIATPDPSTAIVDTETLPIAEALTQAESHHPPEEHEDSPLRNPPHLYLVNTNPTPEEPAPATTAAPPSTLRAARYLQPVSAKATRAATRQDVERLSRLHEAGEAAHLVLHFGEHTGNTLLQVARNDPDYVRRLALTAQRGRANTRRVRADGR